MQIPKERVNGYLFETEDEYVAYCQRLEDMITDIEFETRKPEYQEVEWDNGPQYYYNEAAQNLFIKADEYKAEIERIETSENIFPD